MIRRRTFELPYADQVPRLVPLLGDPDSIPVQSETPDPARLLDAALGHGLGLALADAVESGRIRLPADQRRRLGRIAAMRVAQSEALRDELEGLAEPLTEACGAKPICIKGPAVADRLYDDRRYRTFGDLDLLLPRERLRDGADALIGAGWTEDVEFSPDFADRYGHELHLRRRRGGIWLHCELHWRIGDDALCESLDYGLLRRSATALKAVPALLAPAADIELLMLCVHFIGDRERRLIWLGDIRRGAERASREEWQRCFELAARLGLSWALHRALDYGERYAGLDRARPADEEGDRTPPPFGPLRAVEELDMRASLHVGRLAQLRGRDRLRYLRTILVPTGEGLEGTAGRDGAPTWRALLRHLGTALAGLRPRD